MLKRVVQSLFNSFGYTVTCNARFGRDPWQDIKFLSGSLRSPLVFDVGAHQGQTLQSIRGIFPHARVHCFEPDPDTFQKLAESARGLAEVTLHPMALGDQKGQLPFHRNKESMTNSLLASAPGAGGEVETIMMTQEEILVPVMRLDDFCAEKSIDAIHLLKTDCQGFDLRVLMGAEHLLSQGRIELVVCEAIFDSEYVGQGYFHEILAFLTQKGYALCGIYHAARNSRNEMTFADVLFRKSTPPAQ